MIILALTCLAAAVGVGFWSRDAFARSVIACGGRRPKDLPRTDQDLASRYFILGHVYGLMALALALVAGSLL